MRPTPYALATAIALTAGTLGPARDAAADPPGPASGVRPARRPSSVDTSDARRASDRMRRHRRFERTLDPTVSHGRPLRVALATPPVAFGPAPLLPADATPPARAYDHVVIVSLDGLRPDAIDMTDAPNLRMLRRQGANATEARTITHSYTLPSHTSMLTGVDTDRHGLVHNNYVPNRGFVRVPTIFYRAHDAGFTTAMFVSKPKFRHIAVPGSVDEFARPDYACPRVVAAAAAHVARAGAGITFVHLSEPDEYGHSRGWMTEAYLRGIATADRCLGTLLTAVAQRPDLHRVLILVSADHGGHGRTHGSERDEDMRIPWIAWGSRVVRGAFASPVSTMDTAATALAALGIAVGEAEIVGRPVRLALDGGVPAPRPSVPGDTPVAALPAEPGVAAAPAPTAALEPLPSRALEAPISPGVAQQDERRPSAASSAPPAAVAAGPAP